MEWLQPLELGIGAVAAVLKLLLEAIAVACVAFGLGTSLKTAVEWLRDHKHNWAFSAFRMRLGRWLVLALEFQLAADIVSTTVAPSTEALAKLAAIAAIRTFLNYFLQKELEVEQNALKGSAAMEDR